MYGVPSTFRISLANRHIHLHSDSWSSVSKMSSGHLSSGQRRFLWDNQDVKRWTDQSVDFWVFCGIIGFCAASTSCCETSAKRSQDGWLRVLSFQTEPFLGARLRGLGVFLAALRVRPFFSYLQVEATAKTNCASTADMT